MTNSLMFAVAITFCLFSHMPRPVPRKSSPFVTVSPINKSREVLPELSFIVFLMSVSSAMSFGDMCSASSPGA